MTTTSTETSDPRRNEADRSWASMPSQTSAVAWGAILAGAAAAASLSLILLMLGTGLGLSSVSPWAQDGVSAGAFGVSTIVWLTLTQLVASGLGGYLAGRLRTTWVEAHSDEVFFRDSAHGFLSWAVASLVTAGLLTSATLSIVSGGVQAGASIVDGVATSAVSAGSAMAEGAGDDAGGLQRYFVDSLFRADANTAAARSRAGTATDAGEVSQSGGRSSGELSEVAGIFARAVRTDNLPQEDTQYLGQIVASRTGLTQREAETRITDTYDRMRSAMDEAETKAREAVDAVRKAAAYAALWIFITLLIGAFAASFAATFGGRRRDDAGRQHPHTRRG